MPLHESSECRFGAALGVIVQELLVAQAVHSWNNSRRRSNRTGGNSFRPHSPDFPGSAIVPIASVGVPPAESSNHHKPAFLVNPRALGE
jgi:hypothetical protein